MMPGTFIVLDGPDATGTSTHARLLAERLHSEGHDVLLTSEPTDGPVGKQIRQYLSTGEADPLELQMLFTEDRAWHVEHVIAPALAEGKIVICDRYSPSTIVYAGAQGLPSSQITLLNTKFVQPDCTIFTLPPLEVAMRRLAKRAQKEIFEREEFQQKIHEGYLAYAKANPGVRVVDTSGEKTEVAEQIWGIVKSILSARKRSMN